MSDKDLTFSIAKLEFVPGDVLVVKGPVPQHHEVMHRFVPPGVRVLYIPAEVELSVMTKGELAARLGADVAPKVDRTPPVVEDHGWLDGKRTQ